MRSQTAFTRISASPSRARFTLEIWSWDVHVHRCELTEHHSLAAASQRVPHGVICLLSALQFHGIGTQAPFEVWVAIDVHARRPNSDVISLRPVYMSGLALSAGIETHAIEGTRVQVFNSAKTIVDCF